MHNFSRLSGVCQRAWSEFAPGVLILPLSEMLQSVKAFTNATGLEGEFSAPGGKASFEPPPTGVRLARDTGEPIMSHRCAWGIPRRIGFGCSPLAPGGAVSERTAIMRVGGTHSAASLVRRRRSRKVDRGCLWRMID